MKRFLAWSVIAFLVLVVATPVNAGYLIIRVLLEGGTGQGGNEPGRPGQPPMPSGRSGPLSGSGQGPGRPAMPSGPGMPSAPGHTATSTHADPSKSIVVVVPIEEDLSISAPFYPKRNPNTETNPNWKPKLHTLFHGEKYITNLFSDGSTIQWYRELVQIPGPKKTRNSEVKDLHIKWSKQKDPTFLMMALNAAMAVGMIDEAVTYSDELLAYANEKPPGIPVDVATFTAAYAKMQKGIKGQQFGKPGKPEWVRKLGAPNSQTRNHYTLIYWDATDAELKRRFEVLEDNFKAFFIYHALRGIELLVPETPLIAVLPKQGNDVFTLAKALDVSTRLTTDGFYSPEHDLLVMSPDALDDVRATFARQNQQVYQMGVSRADLLKGDGPRIKEPNKGIGGIGGQPGQPGQPGGSPDFNPSRQPGSFPGQPGANGQNPPGKDGMKAEEVAHMQTIALIDTFSEDAAITCSISREASRQLLYATQQLPRYVELPEWLIHGAGDFYMRPNHPAFVTNANGKQVMHIADATGYGVPNYVLQRYFRDLMEKNDLNADRAALLKNVLTDAYFLGLKSKETHDPDPAKKDTRGIEIGGGNQPATNPMGRPGGAQPPGPMPGSGSYSGSSGPRPQPGVPAPGANAKEEEDDQNTILRKKRERLTIKSQATAWALYYYLSKSQPDKFRAFLNELAAMPRDVPLEGAAVQAFYRVFNLDGSKESLDRFATEWLNYINHIAPAGLDIVVTEPKSANP